MSPHDLPRDTIQLLTFWLGPTPFGLDIGAVREIIPSRPLAAVPRMPAFVCGMLNLRGAVLPVVDLQARLGRPPAVPGKRSCIVIVDQPCAGERVELGLLVDAVSEVVRVHAEQLEPPPDFGAAVRRDFIGSVAKVGPRFVTVLDPERALDLVEMTALCERAQAAAA